MSATRHHDLCKRESVNRVARAAQGDPAGAVIGIAASAGSLKPLREILGALPREFPAAVLVAFHTGPRSMLPTVLAPHCRLPVKFAERTEIIRAGVVYTAPPLGHLVANADRTLSGICRPHVRFVRPSADWLFDTLAATYADAAIAIVLSGYRDDGARGAVRIRSCGGLVLAQRPDTCAVPEMPRATIRTGAAIATLPPDEMAPALMTYLTRLDLLQEQQKFRNPFAA